MFELHSTTIFDRWLRGLKDRTTRNKVLARLARVESGNLGDCRQIDGRLLELRLFFSGGLRIYFTIRDQRIVLLLAGGDKSSQSRDIEKARQLLQEQDRAKPG